MSRARSIGKDGVFLDPVQPAAQLDEKKQRVEQLKNFGMYRSVITREENIRADFRARGLDTTGDTVDALIHQLAVMQLLWAAEQIYNIIFGSQIYLLKWLNQSISGLPKQKVADFFSGVQERNSTFQTWSLEGYLGFLIARGLIVSKNDTYFITTEGIDFLTWMASVGRPETK